MNIILRNNPGNRRKKDLIKGFVVRTKQFNTIYNELSKSISDKPEQSYLIIGQRGAGKTTLLYRLKYEIEDRLTETTGLIPIMLNEEQYNIADLHNLWETVIENLNEIKFFPELNVELQKLSNEKFYEEKVFDALESKLKSEHKKIIIFFENIDVFFRKIGTSGQKRLREILLSSNYIRLIATSTTYFEAITDYSKPFYDFFKVIELKGLSKIEAIDLLLKIGDEYGKRDEIEAIILKNPQRVEALRRLTGGIPRTISYLFQIFLDNQDGKAIKDLYQLIDTLTFLYKSELDQLSTQQQKIIDVIAKNWDAIAVKEISEKTRFESKLISSVLQTLEKNQIVEVVPTKTKNNLYRVADRFMNIWYLMRFGKRHEKDNVIWLVRFYDIWCDKEELAKQIRNHISNLQEGRYDFNAALYMGNTFLSCENASEELKYNLYKTTKAILPKQFLRELKYSDGQLYERLKDFLKAKKYAQAIELLDEIDKKDNRYYNFASYVYSSSKKYDLAEAAAEKAFELSPTDSKAAFRVGYINDYYLHNQEKAIDFFKQALDLGEYRAANVLGDIYMNKSDFESARKYHQIASKNGYPYSFLSLATIDLAKNDIESAEKNALKALQNKIEAANINLGILKTIKKDYKKAEIYFNKAVEKGINEAYVSLGMLYLNKAKPDYKKVEEYFKIAFEKKVDTASIPLGKLYVEKLHKEKEGIRLLTKEAKAGKSEAAHYLGHYYADQKEFTKSDNFFFQAFKLGRKSAILCFISEVVANGRKDMKQKSLELLEENISVIKEIGIVAEIEYAFVLLWNDKIEKSIRIYKEQLSQIEKAFTRNEEEETEDLMIFMTQFMIGLIAKGQYKAAYDLLVEGSTKQMDLKQIMKPVYYALMNFMKDEFPKEYLKAGEELTDTVNEVIVKIDKYKVLF